MGYPVDIDSFRFLPVGKLIAPSIAIAGLGLGFAAPAESFPAAVQTALGLTFFAAVLWSTQAIPLELTSLVLLLLMPALGLLDFTESFAPFSQKTLWLLFAGMVISQAMTHSGTDEYLAWRFSRAFSSSPFRLLLNLHLLGLAMAVVVPSGMIRVLILIPLGLKLATNLGGTNDRSFNAAILCSIVCSTFYGGFGVLTGSVPNIVLAGQLEQHGGHVLLWTEWLRLMFPIMGVLRTCICFAVIWMLWGRKIGSFSPQAMEGPKVPLRLNKRLTVILVVGVLFWMTDIYHMVAPTYVGLFMVVVLLAPHVGVLPISELRKINFPFFLYFAALISLGSALDGSGFSQEFAKYAVNLFDPGNQGWLGRHLTIVCMLVPLNFLMEIAAVVGMITPTMLEIGRSMGIPELPMTMCIAMGATLVFLPYQAAPFMIALNYRQLPALTLITAIVSISVITLVLLCPLNLLYWRWLGFL